MNHDINPVDRLGFIQQLLTADNQLDSALEGDKRFKKEDAQNLRNMCVNNHELNMQIMNMIKIL